MEKIAIISDIHANLEALQAVVTDIKKQGITHIYALGDIVGYGADPYECLAYLKQHSIPSVQGNHDYMASANKYPATISSMAKLSLEWTYKSLSAKSKKYLINLPLIHKANSAIVLVHASLYQAEKWHYLKAEHEESILDHFASQMTPICCVGHTHIPSIIQKKCDDQTIHELGEVSILLDLKHQYIINPGSVGFSRDQDYRASYVSIQINHKAEQNHTAQVNFHRVDYNRQLTLEKLQKNSALSQVTKHFS